MEVAKDEDEACTSRGLNNSSLLFFLTEARFFPIFFYSSLLSCIVSSAMQISPIPSWVLEDFDASDEKAKTHGY